MTAGCNFCLGLQMKRANYLMKKHFQPNFVPAFYRSLHPDLARHTDADLVLHYELHGKAEGRVSSPTGTRQGFVEAINKAKRPLEIGPFCKPMLSGKNAKFFDVLDREAMKERAVEAKGDPERVPYIDFISPIGDLSIIREKFDLITSSHCVEHQPDLVRHLQDVEALLEDGGVYALIVPDRRYCFDYFLHDSHIGEVLEAYYTERKVHGLAKIIEHRAMTTHHETDMHWRGDHGQKPKDLAVIAAMIKQWEAANGGYIDVHAWQFTPDNFASIISDLSELGLISFKIGRIYETAANTHEFCVVLVR